MLLDKINIGSYCDELRMHALKTICMDRDNNIYNPDLSIISMLKGTHLHTFIVYYH